MQKKIIILLLLVACNIYGMHETISLTECCVDTITGRACKSLQYKVLDGIEMVKELDSARSWINKEQFIKSFASQHSLLGKTKSCLYKTCIFCYEHPIIVAAISSVATLALFKMRSMERKRYLSARVNELASEDEENTKRAISSIQARGSNIIQCIQEENKSILKAIYEQRTDIETFQSSFTNFFKTLEQEDLRLFQNLKSSACKLQGSSLLALTQNKNIFAQNLNNDYITDAGKIGQKFDNLSMFLSENTSRYYNELMDSLNVEKMNSIIDHQEQITNSLDALSQDFEALANDLRSISESKDKRSIIERVKSLRNRLEISEFNPLEAPSED